MAKKVVSFSLAQGRRDRIDPKLAPFGVVSNATNMRVRKDGRLALRYGYHPLDMRTAGGTLVAYDLHEYQGRLIALGSHSGSGFPERPYEYTGLGAGNQFWRYETDKQELTPFVDLKDITIMSPPSGGADMVDTAGGGGYVLCITRSTGNIVTAVIVRESDNQPICTEVLSTTQSTRDFRCTFSVDSFYIASQKADHTINLLAFKVGTDTAFQNLLQISGPIATPNVYDIAPVDNPTTGRIAYTRDRGTTIAGLVRIYDSTGAVVGSDINFGAAADNAVCMGVTADQTANVIHSMVALTTGAVQLRSFTFAGTPINSVTSGTTSTRASICRIPATAAAGAATQLAVAIITSTLDTIIEYYAESTYALTTSTTVFQAVCTSRLLNWTTPASTNANNKYAVVFGGYVAPDISSGEFPSNALFFAASGSSNAAHMVLRDFTRAKIPTRHGLGLHLDSSTGRVTWCALRDAGTGSGQAAVTTFPKDSAARRQSAKFGDLLYLASAPIQVYDGRCLTEPFQELPGILSGTPSNGAGALTNSAEYDFVLHWEMTLADGSLWQSAPSAPFTLTMGATDDTVTLITSSPHMLTCVLSPDGYGPEITEVISRTVWDGSKGAVFRRTATDNITGAGNDYGSTVTIIDETSDTDLRDEEAIYTQADRGVFSGPLEHDGPQPCKFIAATESRMLTGGLLRRSKFQMSKEAFLDEPFTWSEFSSFFSQVSGQVRGLASLDGARLVFTADDIFSFFGDGPDDIGGGAIGRAQDIPTPSGLEDWRSLLKGPDGLYFQLDDDKLYRIPRGGGAPEWIGIDVIDTLTRYPVITGACRHRRADTAMFACEKTTSDDARLLVRSFRTGIWTEDIPPLSTNQGIEAIVNYGDTVAYVSGGVVWVQTADSFRDLNAVAYAGSLRTHPLYPFGLGGYGTLWELIVTCELRGAGILSLNVSYDDGVTFTAYDSFNLPVTPVGSTVQKKWSIQQSDFTSLVLDFTIQPFPGSPDSDCVIIEDVSLLVEPEEGLREIVAGDSA